MVKRSDETFRTAVLGAVRAIKKGETASYKEVAARAGNPRAARAVARIMAANFDPTVPCHRVICTNGALGGYNRGGTTAKRQILLREGVKLQ